MLQPNQPTPDIIEDQAGASALVKEPIHVVTNGSPFDLVE
jgi:hypothetical protein